MVSAPAQNGDREDFGRVIHAIISAASVLAINVEALIESGAGRGEKDLVDDTRGSLDRIVELAREAQRLQGKIYPT